MSSTNRGTIGRHISDYYQTPKNVIEELMDELEKSTNIFDKSKRILDPCAGGSTDNPMAYQANCNKKCQESSKEKTSRDFFLEGEEHNK